MKKRYRLIAALMMALFMASCAGTPPAAEEPAIDTPLPPDLVPDPAPDIIPDLEPDPVPDPAPEPDPVPDTAPEPEPVPDPVISVELDMAADEDAFSIIPPLAFDEPEPPVTVVITEPPVSQPEPEPEPPLSQPEPEPEPVPALSQPEPVPAAPVAAPPQAAAPVAAAPVTAAPVAAPSVAAPPVAAEPVAEPVPETPVPALDTPVSMPELPYPSSALSGRQDESVIFSRTVRATVGQLVEIPFRGTGWVYLGEAASRRGIVYDSRRLDFEGQSFIFKTESPGEYTLKFYRQDFIRDFILNDYVQVIVGAPPETAGTGWFNPPIDRGRVVAEPRWPTSLEEAQVLRADVAPTPSAPTPATPTPTTPAAPSATTAPAVTPATSTPTATPAPTASAAEVSPSDAAATVLPPPPIDPETYLEQAKEEFNAGRVAAAISLLDQFCAYYPQGSDEVWWLYGQFYEANGPQRDILTSLNYYRRLVQEYPQSSRYDDARRRIAYLQRYYININ